LTYRRSRTDTLQLKAEVARLSRGVVQQSDLLRRAEDERHSLDLQGKADSAARASLVAQSQELQKKMAAEGGVANSELQKQLLDTQGRLNALRAKAKLRKPSCAPMAPVCASCTSSWNFSIVGPENPSSLPWTDSVNRSWMTRVWFSWILTATGRICS